MRSTFKYCFSICCSKCIHSPYCSVIQWNLSVLQEISGRTDGILKPCKDTHLLPNGDGYESGLWTKGSLVCENAVDETYEVKFPFRWCPEYEDIWQIWHDDRVLGHHVMKDRINPVLHISFGHNSGLITLICSFTVWEAFFSLVLIMARSSTEWKKKYMYICVLTEMCKFFLIMWLISFLCFPKLKIIQVSVSEAWECCYFFSEH